MAFGLEKMFDQYDVTVIVRLTNLCVQPINSLRQEVIDEVVSINQLMGYKCEWNQHLMGYLVTIPVGFDVFAVAERIAIGLEEKGVKVQRINDNMITKKPCQSFILV